MGSADPAGGRNGPAALRRRPGTTPVEPGVPDGRPDPRPALGPSDTTFGRVGGGCDQRATAILAGVPDRRPISGGARLAGCPPNRRRPDPMDRGKPPVGETVTSHAARVGLAPVAEVPRQPDP